MYYPFVFVTGQHFRQHAAAIGMAYHDGIADVVEEKVVECILP